MATIATKTLRQKITFRPSLNPDGRHQSNPQRIDAAPAPVQGNADATP
jgi:hypothetical protein